MYNTMPLLLYPSTPGEQASLPEEGTGGGCESFAGQPEQAGSSCHQPIPVTGVSNDCGGADLINQGLEFLGDTNTCGDRQPPIKPVVKANLNNQVVLVNDHLNHQSNHQPKQLVLVQA